MQDVCSNQFMDVHFTDEDLEQIPEADRRPVDPPMPVDTATWSATGRLDYWVKESRFWMGRVRGVDGKQRWVKATDIRRVNG
jgi:hypothetical protein